uniref:Uncharacterized protein n=1 Tax=Anguilla anguilla TaxID=7936 RepID=A0A0E9PJ48_ANGAN
MLPRTKLRKHRVLLYSNRLA